MDMETLLTAGPDILVLQETASHASDQGALFLTHPALRARYDETKRISLPSRYTLCGGPALLEGLGVLKDALKMRRVGRELVHAPAVIEILRDAAMGIQPRVLIHVADAAAVWRHVQFPGGVIHRLAPDDNGAPVGLRQACDHVDDRAFARAGCAEQAGDPAVALERGLQPELAELLGDVDAQHVTAHERGAARVARRTPTRSARRSP